MIRQILSHDDFPGISVEIARPETDGEEGVMAGWTRVNILNSEGGIARTNIFPTPLVDQHE